MDFCQTIRIKTWKSVSEGVDSHVPLSHLRHMLSPDASLHLPVIKTHRPNFYNSIPDNPCGPFINKEAGGRIAETRTWSLTGFPSDDSFNLSQAGGTAQASISMVVQFPAYPHNISAKGKSKLNVLAMVRSKCPPSGLPASQPSWTSGVLYELTCLPSSRQGWADVSG